jgi:serine/threonine-protein kinase HipA
MSYLLQNGDAHLKNFGVLYDETFSSITFAPAYDIVNTCVYIFNDRPALTMFGKRLWFGKKELIKFGVEHCYLSTSKSQHYYQECLNALKESITELSSYIQQHPEFKTIGTRMLESWNVSLEEKTYKELSREITRNWSKN